MITLEIDKIVPFDALEKKHLGEAKAWVNSDAELCRTQKPATPPKHSVSYFVVLDGDKVQLVDHINPKLWLPSGGQDNESLS